MPLGEVLEKSFNYVKNNRALWFYGVLLALFSQGQNLNYEFNNNDLKFFGTFSTKISTQAGIAIIVLALILFIVALIVGSWSTAALITGANKADSNKKFDRKELGQTGKGVVIKLIVLNLFIPILLAFGAAIAIAVVVALVILLWQSVKILSILLAVIAALGLIAGIVYLSQLWLLAAPFVVLERQKAWESLKNARALLNGNFWKTFLFSLVLGLITGVSVFALIIPLMVLAVGLFYTVSAKIIWALVVLSILSLAYFGFFVFASGLVQSYIQVAKTLWWSRLKVAKA